MMHMRKRPNKETVGSLRGGVLLLQYLFGFLVLLLAIVSPSIANAIKLVQDELAAVGTDLKYSSRRLNDNNNISNNNSRQDNNNKMNWGSDLLCWKSRGVVSGGEISHHHGKMNITTAKDLIQNFSLESNLELYSACPVGNSIEALAPQPDSAEWNSIEGFASKADWETAHDENSKRASLWIDTAYPIPVTAYINLTSIWSSSSSLSAVNETSTSLPLQIISDYGPAVVLHVMACPIASIGICMSSPVPLQGQDDNTHQQGTDGSSLLHDGSLFDRGSATNVNEPIKIVPLTSNHGSIFSIQDTVSLTVHEPGEYYLMVALTWYAYETNATESVLASLKEGSGVGFPVLRWDMSSALPWEERVVTFQAPPSIQSVDSTASTIGSVLLALACAMLVILMILVLRYRRQPVLQSSLPFYGFYLVVALTCVLGTLWLDPTDDLHCQVRLPWIVLSLHLLFSLLLAHVHDVCQSMRRLCLAPNRNSILNVPNKMPTPVAESWMEGLLNAMSSCCGVFPCVGRGQDRRRRVQSVAAVTCFLMVPQVVLQVCALVLQPQQLEIELDESSLESSSVVGRVTCNTVDDVSTIASLQFYGLALLILLLMFFLLATQALRSLPTFWQETERAATTALSSTGLLLVALGLYAMWMQDETLSPNVLYLFCVTLTIALALNATARLIAPKLFVAAYQERQERQQLQQQEQDDTPADTEMTCMANSAQGMPYGPLKKGRSTKSRGVPFQPAPLVRQSSFQSTISFKSALEFHNTSQSRLYSDADDAVGIGSGGGLLVEDEEDIAMPGNNRTDSTCTLRSPLAVHRKACLDTIASADTASTEPSNEDTIAKNDTTTNSSSSSNRSDNNNSNVDHCTGKDDDNTKLMSHAIPGPAFLAQTLQLQQHLAYLNQHALSGQISPSQLATFANWDHVRHLCQQVQSCQPRLDDDKVNDSSRTTSFDIVQQSLSSQQEQAQHRQEKQSLTSSPNTSDDDDDMENLPPLDPDEV